MTAEELKALRARLGLSLVDMSREMGIAGASGKSVSTLCRYLNGKLEIPEWFARGVQRLRPRRKR